MLREWNSADGQWYVAQLGEPAIQQFTVESVDTSASEFESALAQAASSTDIFARAIVDPETGDLAGNLAASQESDGTAEVHYWLSGSARGRGLATTAVTETIAWIQREWPSVTRVSLRMRAGNEASVRVALRSGFERDATLDTVSQVRGESWVWLGYSRTLKIAPARMPAGRLPARVRPGSVPPHLLPRVPNPWLGNALTATDVSEIVENETT